MAVVNDVVPHVDRRPEPLQCQLDNVDCTHDACAEATWIGQHYLHTDSSQSRMPPHPNAASPTIAIWGARESLFLGWRDSTACRCEGGGSCADPDTRAGRGRAPLAAAGHHRADRSPPSGAPLLS